MVIIITFGGDVIPKSPFTVGVAAPLDLSKVQVNGLDGSKYTTLYFHIRALKGFYSRPDTIPFVYCAPSPVLCNPTLDKPS